MIEKEFRVVSLHASPDEGVYIDLAPIFKIEVTREEPAPPPPERVILGPTPKTEEEKIVRSLVRATVEEYGRLGLLPPPPPTHTAVPSHLRSFGITLHLTKEEYEELKPSIGQTIMLILAQKGETHEC